MLTCGWTIMYALVFSEKGKGGRRAGFVEEYSCLYSSRLGGRSLKKGE